MMLTEQNQVWFIIHLFLNRSQRAEHVTTGTDVSSLTHLYSDKKAGKKAVAQQKNV